MCALWILLGQVIQLGSEFSLD
ncbi:hypothetical protein F383_37749 [Gossypium arboreum]|uniref:Uncharacterized protein n=1 Tax=Gossypium arboreum TaxID=29729 RepID=A0A0B0MH14_GOSAR|nr:hypothetical protein F383_37749 [Gossypium arboreum]